VEFQERRFWRRQVPRASARKRARAAYDCLPLRRADRVVLGHEVGFYQDWLKHERREDSWWAPLDFSRDMSAVPPASLVAGWFDVFLAEQVQDYLRLRQAGRQVRLTIGPWTHTNTRVGAVALRDALDWFDVHLRSRPQPPGAPRVRLYVMGGDRWVDLPDWPPPSTGQRWYLHPAGRLYPRPPRPGPPDGYRYDPANPTPGVGGASLNTRNAGSRDQEPRETRADVLCYTSDPCRSDVTVAGAPRAEVWLRTSQPCVDVFVRLCDVEPSGRSRNISDGIVRIDPAGLRVEAGGARCVGVNLAPTAITFRRGHRIRLQVSSGAHPLVVRNTGSGERLGTAARLVSTDVQVIHDPGHPSMIELPVSPI
jgi:putative CocE/NonD family hydrolase